MNPSLVYPLTAVLCALSSLVTADETLVRAFLQDHCYKCHGWEHQEAGLRLDRLALDGDLRPRDRWRNATG
jgi:hypothetical protein